MISVAHKMIPTLCEKMLAKTLSRDFAPPAARQTVLVFFLVLSAARERYCLRAMISKLEENEIICCKLINNRLVLTVKLEKNS